MRKQQEVNRAKATTSMPEYVPSKKSTEPKEPKQKKERKVTELEDSSQLARSKKMLEAKAKYYDKMTKAGGSLNSDENCLVMFNQKHQAARYDESSEEEDIDESAYPSEDWVEYTDCLGRTRKCLKKDLESFQQRDEELQKVVEARNKEQSDLMAAAGPSVEEKSPEVEITEEEKKVQRILEQTEDVGERFMEQREKWDQQQTENLQKDFVHYQDVLFDGEWKIFDFS